MATFLSIAMGISMRSMPQSLSKGLSEEKMGNKINIKITNIAIHDNNVCAQQETFQVFHNGCSVLKHSDGHTFAKFRQTTKGDFKGAERDSMALIPDATKALEAEGAIIVWARDEANDRMKSIIIKGQAERAGAQKLRGNLKRDDG
jgi:hypothetical protein